MTLLTTIWTFWNIPATDEPISAGLGTTIALVLLYSPLRFRRPDDRGSRSSWVYKILDATAFATGLVFCFAWLPAAIRGYTRWAGFTNVAAVVALALCLGGARTFELELSRRLVARVGIFASALVLATLDHLRTSIFPWLEPLSLPFVGSRLPLSAPVLGTTGPFGFATLLSLMLLAFWLRRAAVLALTVALYLLIALAAPNTDGASGEHIRVAGLQAAPVRVGPDWREDTLAAMLALEQGLTVDLVVWPEGSYPWRERITESLGFDHLDPNRSFSRVIGVVGPRTLGGPLFNSAVLQSDELDEARIAVHRKQELAPFEARAVSADSASASVVVWREMKVALPICYEIMDRSLVSGGGPDLVVSISADAFDVTGRASNLMSRSARLRAIELQRPVVRVSNASGSAAFGPGGEILAASPAGSAILTAEIPLGECAPDSCERL